MSSLIDLDQATNENDANEVQDHVFMAVDKTVAGTVGCAYYVARYGLLCCVQDIVHSTVDVLDLLKLDIEPTTMLVSSRIDLTQLNGTAIEQSYLANDDAEHSPLPYDTIIRPASDFWYDLAIQKLSSLNGLKIRNGTHLLVPGNDTSLQPTSIGDSKSLVDHEGRLLTIATILDFSNKISIGCAGAVISHILRRCASEYIQHDPEAQRAYRIRTMEMAAFSNTMLLDVNTLTALSIIRSEIHPSIANQGPDFSKSKESLSVYGLFHNHAKTTQGRVKLKEMFLHPSLCRTLISGRHQFISVFVRTENNIYCQALRKSLRHIKNLRLTLTSLRKGTERGIVASGSIRSGVWAALLEFCYHSIDITDTLRTVVDPEAHEVLTAIRACLDKARLQQLGKMIHDVIDLNESHENSRTVIRRGIDADLDRVKNAYNTMEEILAEVARAATNSMPPAIQHRLDAVFLPQLGFHLAVPLDQTTWKPVWTGMGLWEERFRTESHVYFKSDEMRDMDATWGDLHARICDTEIEISYELAQRVLRQEDWLIQASDACGDLDSLLALSHVALQYGLTRPKMTEQNIIDIKGGWHILQDLMVASFITNDALLAGGDEHCDQHRIPSMVLLTGPNHSGKSVYMKQVALIVYLAQVGSFVPAKEASLGITDKIFTRINASETVSALHGPFVNDLQQISRAVRSCTSQSLIVIDEFGKGTEPCDGAGLVAGIYTFLLKLGIKSPKVLASTHFHEIFDRINFDSFLNLALAHMEVYLHGEPARTNMGAFTEAVYLYNLRRGRSQLSYGNKCAAMAGIPSKIVERAGVLTDLLIRGEDLVTTCTTMPTNELEELEGAETVCRMFLHCDFGKQSEGINKILQNICSSATAELLKTRTADTANQSV